ncbi:TrkA C-terminal domain-containing protein [Bacillus massilinigeriensis]|uniref:TrkA C-terminal domain-containing protein n=1 Tax=Bacillus mediterraneensis TaxID=1805474 RepID=UPI0009F311F4|nr:TrkA C-terminal domain-containing protein [Bacillus mediterraneensis]
MNVLFIRRGDVKVRKNAYDTELHPGDRAVVYGNTEQIRAIFPEEILRQQVGDDENPY